MESQSWRKEPRKIYSNDFKLRIVELASRPDACVAQIARENGVNDNVIFKWLQLWQKEGRVSRRLPATINTSTSAAILPVEVLSDTPSDELKTDPELLPVLNAASCCVEFRYGKMTLEKPSSELLAVLRAN
ncbi:transposase [Salmonella enterica]|nr:transposase [Salmonella enterica]